MPPKRRLLILINPFSGRRLAPKNWNKARPILEKAHVNLNVVFTERAMHAYDIAKELDPDDYDGVVTVSGDGLIHEVVNGLHSRLDWESNLKI
jgi:sphingosine kinase